MSFENTRGNSSFEEQVEVVRQLQAVRTEVRPKRPLRSIRGGSRGPSGGRSRGDRGNLRGGFRGQFYNGRENKPSSGSQTGSAPQQITSTQSVPFARGGRQLVSASSPSRLELNTSIWSESSTQVSAAPGAHDTSSTLTSTIKASDFGERMDMGESPIATIRQASLNRDYAVLERSLLDEDNLPSISQAPLVPSRGRRENVCIQDARRGDLLLKRLGGLGTSRWAK